MKKFLLSLVSLFMLTLFAQAGEPVKKLTFPTYNDKKVQDYTSEWTATVEGDVWTLSGFNNNNSGWAYVKCGSKSAATTATITSPAVNVAIANVVFSVTKTSNVTSATLTILNGETVVGEPIDITESFAAGDVNVKVAGAAGYSYKLTLENAKASSNGSTEISKVALYEEGQFEEVHIANTAETAYTVAEAMDLIDAGQALGETVYVKGIVSQVDKFNDTYKSIQYWISDDGTTTNQFECYSGKGIGGADFASVDDVKVGATVVVKGLLAKFGEIYEFKQNNELVSYVAPAPLGDDFEAMAESNAIGIRTYAGDIKGEEVATMQKIAGWEIVSNGDGRAAGIFAYGSAAFLGGEGYVAPAAPFFKGATKALGICAVWSASLQYTKKIDLKAGKYMLQVPVYNAGGATAIANNLIGVDGTYSATKTFAVGGWTVENVEFTVAEDKTVTLSLGYAAANVGSNAMPHLFLESAIIYSGDEAIAAAKAAAETRAAELALAKAKADALAKLNAYVIGTGLFQYSQTDIDDAKAAVEAATTVEEVAAVPAPAVTAPDAEKFYSFKLKEGGNYLAADGGIKLAEKAMGFKFVAAEGGYALTADGINYVAFIGTGDNTWSMGLTEAPYTWVVTCLADGEYTLSKVGKPAECIGVNNTTAGSSCFANKPADAKGTWAIAEYVAPEPTPEPTPEPEVFAYQKYIIKNVESGMFWGAGNDWGTQASLVAHPEYVKLDPNGDGTYKLESQVNNGGTKYYFNGSYMDNDQPVALTITKLENGNYTIANGTNYFGWDGTSTVLGQNLAADSKNAEWTIQSLDDAKAALVNATVEAPMDATLLIEDHDFGRNNRYVDNWTIEASNKTLSGGNNKNNCAESFHSTFMLSQVLQGAPKGVYAMTAQGFYRQDGTDNDNLPYFYANEEKATFPLLTGSEDKMSAASESFTAGKYTIDPIFVKVEEGGTLTIGAKLETNTALWCIWDNFVLTYYGNCDLAEAKFSGLVAQVNALKAEAEALVANTGNVSETTVAALQAAIAATESIEATEEAYKAVINGLTAAVNQGKLDVNNKAAIDAMYALIESTNVYTAEAKTTYTAEADGYKAAWEAGTLTTKVDNPATIHDWHAANTADDFLLSAWTINDVQAKEFDTALYINTWSDEGEKDGSEFKVPFFEYWTGDANSLGAAKLTATMTGLTAGLYEVSAWVRVRAKNGFTAPATGITMDVNGGEATDVAAGTQVENTQFFLANFKAVGVVGEDGVLKANFNVAADNNISWLSFKNVKFAPKDETEYAYEQALASIEDGKGYRVFTEVGENKFYLTTTGTLVASKEQAANFNFKAVTIANGAYPTGWNLGCKFTNPSLTNGSTGDIVQNGKINVEKKSDRNDWERQVFFLKDGKYAVRATNAKGSNWGANTYWTVTNTEAELPNAGYSLDMNYVWQLEDSSFDLLLKDLNDIIARGNAFAVECGEESLAALNAIDVAALTTSEQVASAIAEAKSIIANYIAGVEYTRLLNVTTAVVANPTPMTIDGWEGDSFGDASDGVCEYWNKAAADFHQTVTLPAGNYRLTVVALQRVNQTGVVYAGENKTTIVQVASSVANKRAQAADWFAAGNGKNEVYFNMAEAGDIVIGLTADGTTPDYWTVWQSFALEKVADVAYEQAYSALAAALQTGKPDSTGVGDGLFMKPTEAYKAALAAYNAAKAALDNAESTADQLTAALAAFNESVATYAAVPVTTPKADVRYVFKQKATGKFLSVYVEKNDAEEVTANGVRLSDEAQGFTWNETEGGYYLSNEVGYVGLAGTNVWTMSALEANKVVINATPAEIVEGVVYYTLNEKNGVIGADDDMVCYANKGKDDKSLWYIDEYVAPANIEIASVTYGGEVVTFDDNNAATIDGAYDAEKELVVTAEDSEAVEVTITYPTEVGQTELVITVTDKNNVLYPDNKATYTITFSVATGINALAAEDGKAVIYDMNGRRVSRNAKGVLIINGKKQLIK